VAAHSDVRPCDRVPKRGTCSNTVCLLVRTTGVLIADVSSPISDHPPAGRARLGSGPQGDVGCSASLPTNVRPLRPVRVSCSAASGGGLAGRRFRCLEYIDAVSDEGGGHAVVDQSPCRAQRRRTLAPAAWCASPPMAPGRARGDTFNITRAAARPTPGGEGCHSDCPSRVHCGASAGRDLGTPDRVPIRVFGGPGVGSANARPDRPAVPCATRISVECRNTGPANRDAPAPMAHPQPNDAVIAMSSVVPAQLRRLARMPGVDATVRRSGTQLRCLVGPAAARQRRAGARRRAQGGRSREDRRCRRRAYLR